MEARSRRVLGFRIKSVDNDVKQGDVAITLPFRGTRKSVWKVKVRGSS